MASNRAQELVIYTCDSCASKGKVRWYCNDCHKNLCDRCKEFHSREKKTKNDDVVPVGKANRHGDKPIPKLCKLHPSKLCDLYCSDCDVLLCNVCLSKAHKQHSWKPFENEFSAKKQHFKEHLTELSAKIDHFRNMTSDRHLVNKTVTDNIDTIRDDVNSQRIKIKAEVDYIADAILAELSSLEKEESAMQEKDCKNSEKKVEELTRMLRQAERTDTTSISLFETEKSLKTTLPLYDVTLKNNLPKIPKFMTGSSDRVKLTEILGTLYYENQYQKVDIDSKHVQRLSKFAATQHSGIFSICPVDDCQAWLIMRNYKGMELVNRKGTVLETVKLHFCPAVLTMVGTTDILMTSNPLTSYIYKLSLHNKQVTAFADIRPHVAWDISIDERGELFVSTDTPDIVVLNQSGTIVRKITIGSEKIRYVVCLSSRRLCVVQRFRRDWSSNKISIADESGAVIQTWTGELDNGQKVGSMDICRMSRDKYDRLFVPDYRTNQVYVLPSDGTQATCLLDQEHGVIRVSTASVDTCGNVWIGFDDGTVHVMRL